MKTAVGYIRVSSEEQARDGVSLANQRAKVEALALCKDLELVEVVEDAGFSAKTLNRPGMLRLLAMVKARKVDAVLINKLDRLTRSVRDLGDLVELFQKTGVDLISVQDSIDTSTAAGRLVLNVMGSVSQWEREVIGERTAEAMSHKKSLREYTGGNAPYGWTLAADGMHLEADPTEQGIIRNAQEMKAAGLALRKVGERLTAQGLLPRSGGRWYAKTVSDLLRAEVA